MTADILDPETLGDDTHPVERLIREVQKRVPGRPLKTETQRDVGAPGQPISGFRIEIPHGRGGEPLVLTGAWHGVQLTFFQHTFLFPASDGDDVGLQNIVRAVEEIVGDALVLHAEPVGARLVRTWAVRMSGAQPLEVLGSHVSRGDDVTGPLTPQWRSWQGTLDRPSTASERRWLTKHTGGGFGWLKRKVADRVLDAVLTRTEALTSSPTPTQAQVERDDVRVQAVLPAHKPEG
jgi:hypothetical protein